MEIRHQYLEHYLHSIALDQLSADYLAKGYQVTKDEKIGSYQADLVAKKGDEIVVVEVKAGTMTPQKRKQVAGIGDFVRTHKNHKFLVVVATPPKPKKIDIPNLNHLLYDYLSNNLPDNLSRLSSHTFITDISDAVTDEVIINEDGSIAAKGSGIIEVHLQYGSDNDENGASAGDAFPFNFDVVLKYNEQRELALAFAEELEIDISSFYE